MTTPFQPVAKCIARWIYEQASWVLNKVKDFLLWLIGKIDAGIVIAKAWLAQWDLVAQVEEAVWAVIKSGIEEAKNRLSAFPDGPAAEVCPEFAEYLTDPAIGMLDSFMNSVTPLREKMHNMVSYMDEIELFIAYWENSKANLLALIQMIDDAMYAVLMREAQEIP